jgi:hypothetical protein
MRRALRTKPVTVFGECPVPLALQNLHYRLLNESIQHRRDGQRKLHWTAVRTWDGRKSIIRFIRFAANDSKYSKSGA